MDEWLTLSDLEPAIQEQAIAVLTDEAERSGDPRWLEACLAGGDLLGGRCPAQVPKRVRDALGRVLTAAIDD